MQGCLCSHLVRFFMITSLNFNDQIDLKKFLCKLDLNQIICSKPWFFSDPDPVSNFILPESFPTNQPLIKWDPPLKGNADSYHVIFADDAIVAVNDTTDRTMFSPMLTNGRPYQISVAAIFRGLASTAVYGNTTICKCNNVFSFITLVSYFLFFRSMLMELFIFVTFHTHLTLAVCTSIGVLRWIHQNNSSFTYIPLVSGHTIILLYFLILHVLFFLLFSVGGLPLFLTLYLVCVCVFVFCQG